VILEPGGGRRELSGAEPATTNNRMELTAAIHALESLPEGSPVDLYTDSRYVQQGITRWLPAWAAQGWKRKEGVIQNLELWRTLDRLARSRRVTWHWLRGHAGHTHNERADRLATAARRSLTGEAETPPAAPAEAEVFLLVSAAEGQGSWAALLRHRGTERLLQGEAHRTTPNRLDLTAAIAALEALPPGTTVAVHTPSDYLRLGASRWLAGWKQKGFRTQAGAPVKNEDLWRRLDTLQATLRVQWRRLAGGPDARRLEQTLGR
jgi:ribonuclease HI